MKLHVATMVLLAGTIVLAGSATADHDTSAPVVSYTLNGTAGTNGWSTMVASRPLQAPKTTKAGQALPIREMSFIDDTAPFQGGRRPAAAGHYSRPLARNEHTPVTI